MEYLVFIALALMFVFMVVFLMIDHIEKERQNYKSFAKQKLSERAKRRDENLEALIESGNIDGARHYLEISRKVDAQIAAGHEDLLEYKK